MKPLEAEIKEHMLAKMQNFPNFREISRNCTREALALQKALRDEFKKEAFQKLLRRAEARK